MTISRFFLTAALASAMLAPVATVAQQTPAPASSAMPADGAPAGGKHEHGVFGRAMRGITLSSAQMAQIKQLHDQYRTAHPAGSPHDKLAEKQLHDAMLNVLTPAQRTQFETNLKELRAEHMQGEPGAAPPTPTPTPSG